MGYYNLTDRVFRKQLANIERRIALGLTTREKEIALCHEHFLRYRPYTDLKRMTDFLMKLAIALADVGGDSEREEGENDGKDSGY